METSFNSIQLKNKTCRTLLQTALVVGVLLGALTRVSATAEDLANQITHIRLFPQPLSWVGEQPPAEAESQTLLTNIDIFKTKGVDAGMAGLESFITVNPHSGWSPALEVSLAEHYRLRGHYTLALARWESAWNATKESKDPAGQKIAARTLAGWTRLLASLGEKEKLSALFKEMHEHQLPLGVYGTTISETSEGLGMMNGKPGLSYRCGSFALGHLAVALGITNGVAGKFFSADSPDGGFNMSQLLALARTNGVAVTAVHCPPGAEVVVPSIVHWKLNHYAAITEKKGNLYRVDDPTFEGHIWMTADAIRDESSGDFILAADKVPEKWKKLSEMACATIYGKGYPNLIPDGDDDGPSDSCGGGDGDDDTEDSSCNPPASNDGPDGGGGGDGPSQCPECAGMPQWFISEPYITVWLRDVPLLYHESDKKWNKLILSYKGRGDAQDPNSPGFGDNWSCNWLGTLVTPSGGEGIFTNNLAGGGVRVFQTGVMDYKSGDMSTTVSEGTNRVPAIVTPTGAQNVYGLSEVYLDGTTRFYPTQRLDRYGRALHTFYYQTNGFGQVWLTNVVDSDGNPNWLGYSDGVHPNLITSVTDPYGQTAYFNYSANGLLTNIVDAQGMTNTFYYDDEVLGSMTTLYGATTFTSYKASTNSPLGRAVLVREASGDEQLYAYCDLNPDGYGDFPWRTSFHWNRAAYAAISEDWQATNFAMPAADFDLASIKLWLHGPPGSNDMATVSDTLGYSADAYDPTIAARPNEMRYDYQGEDIENQFIGNLKRVTGISVVSPAYDTPYGLLSIGRDDLGQPTSLTYYYGPFESPQAAVYQNTFAGNVLQYQIGPQYELTRGYGYDPVFRNLLVSVTNAVTNVVRYTHDTNTLKVTSIIFPSGLVRTNVYYTNGPSKGFLAMQADIGIRTNYFGYADGNLVAQTNELGLVTSYAYDNLNRLLFTTYPDTTTTSNIYDKLDIVATKDRLNQWTHLGYNAVRQLVAVTNVNSQVTQYSYCGCGSPDQITRYNGATPLITTLSYNIQGKLTNAVFPDGYQLAYTYDWQEHLASVTDGAGHQLSVTWFQLGLQSQPQTVELDGQQIFSKQFDPYGNVIQNIDQNGVTQTNVYDFLNRLTSRQFFGSDGVSESGLESFTYNALGLTNYTDQLGHLTTFVRDLAGRVTAETNANRELLQFTYNPADELLTLTDGKSQTTAWNYDQYGRVTNKVDAATNVDFIYQYDVNDRLTNRWTPAKGTTVFRYDPLGNLTNVDYSGGTVSTPSISFAYDGINRLTNMVDGLGSSVFTWTLGDQLASETGPWTDDALTYTYDTSRQRGSMSLLQPNAPPWTQTYGYDPIMRLTSVISPAGAFAYNYIGGTERPYQILLPTLSTGNIQNNFDGLARLTNTSVSVYLASLTLQYGYDPGSEVTQQVFTANNYINYSYDNIGQLKTAQGFEPDGTPRLHEQFGYAYDKAWNLSSRTNNALVQSFGVNNLNELSNGSRTGTLTVAASASESSNYLTSATINGASATIYGDGTFVKSGFTPASGLNTYTASAQDTQGRSDTNSVTVNLPASPSYAYDSNGNLTNDGTRNFAYDDENQLTAVWVGSSWSNRFAYDGMMRKRIEKDYSWNGSSWVETNEVHLVYDGFLVLQERDTNNLPITTYTRGSDMSGTLQGAGGIGGLLARSDRSSVIPYILSSAATNQQFNSYYFSDAMGNIVGLVSQSGMLLAQYEYDPYGNIISMSGLMANANKYRFSSKEWNEAPGLYYYGFRFYEPSFQRWLNQDPIAEKGGFNLFALVANAAINAIDAFGLCDGDVVPPGYFKLFPLAQQPFQFQPHQLWQSGGFPGNLVPQKPWDLGKFLGQLGIAASQPPISDLLHQGLNNAAYNLFGLDPIINPERTPGVSNKGGSPLQFDGLGVKWNPTPNFSAFLNGNFGFSFKTDTPTAGVKCGATITF